MASLEGYIGSWALSEDIQQSEDQVDASVGMQDSEWAKGSSFKVPGSMFEDRFHLGLMGRGQKGWPDFRDNILGDSAGRDKHHERIR